VTVVSGVDDGVEESGVVVCSWLVVGITTAVERVDDSTGVDSGVVVLCTLVIDSVCVTTVSEVVIAVVVTTVVFPEPVACLFASSIKLSATSALL
jgi:hypothetical protein